MHPNEVKLSAFQLAMLLIPGIASTAILGLPGNTAAFALQDAWIAPIATLPASAFIIYVAGALHRRFPGQTFIEYAPRVLGTMPGKFAGALLFWYFFHLDAAIAREFSDFLITTTLARTPSSAILTLGLLAAGLAVRCGPETLGRLGELFTPIAIMVVVVVILTVYAKLDFALLKPVLEFGIRPVFVSGFLVQAFLGQVVLLTILLPSVNDPPNGIRASYWALLVMVILVSAVSAVSIAAFGPVTSSFTWPFFKVARMAGIGPVLARIDPIIIGLWIGGSTLKLALHLYATVLCFTQLVGLKDYRPFVFPMAALVGAYALGHLANIVEHGHMLSYFWPPYTQVFQLFLPTAVLGVAVARRLREDRS